MGDYRIRPVEVEGHARADGVMENAAGAWLGEVLDDQVEPYLDEDGDYIPAPTNWRGRVIEEL